MDVGGDDILLAALDDDEAVATDPGPSGGVHGALRGPLPMGPN